MKVLFSLNYSINFQFNLPLYTICGSDSNRRITQSKAVVNQKFIETKPTKPSSKKMDMRDKKIPKSNC